MSDKKNLEQEVNLGISELLQDNDINSKDNSDFSWLNRELGQESLPNVVLASRTLEQLDEKNPIESNELSSIEKLIQRLNSEGEIELAKLIEEKVTQSTPKNRHSDYTYKFLLICLLLVAGGIFYLLWKGTQVVPVNVTSLPALEMKPVIKPELVFQTVEPAFKPMVEVIKQEVQPSPNAKVVIDTSVPNEPEKIREVLSEPKKEIITNELKSIGSGEPMVNGFPQESGKPERKKTFYVKIPSKVYRYPEYTSAKIGYLNRDDEVKVVSDLGEWVKIRSNYADGYVPSDILDTNKP